MANQTLTVGSVCAVTIDGRIIYGRVLRWNGNDEANLTVVDLAKNLYHPLMDSCYLPGALYRRKALLSVEDGRVLSEQFDLLLSDDKTRRYLQNQIDEPVQWIEVRSLDNTVRRYRPAVHVPPSPGVGAPVTQQAPLRIHRRDAGDGGPPDFTRTFERYVDDALFGDQYREAWDQAFEDLYHRYPERFDAVMAAIEGLSMKEHAREKKIRAATARWHKHKAVVFISQRIVVYADGVTSRVA